MLNIDWETLLEEALEKKEYGYILECPLCEAVNIKRRNDDPKNTCTLYNFLDCSKCIVSDFMLYKYNVVKVEKNVALCNKLLICMFPEAAHSIRLFTVSRCQSAIEDILSWYLKEKEGETK